jgi:hypothetical protein
MDIYTSDLEEGRSSAVMKRSLITNIFVFLGRWMVAYHVVKPSGTKRETATLIGIGLMFRIFSFFSVIGVAQLIDTWSFPNRLDKQYTKNDYLIMGIVLMIEQCIEAAIAALTYEDQSNVKKDITGLKKDVTELKKDVTELKKDVTELKQDVASLKCFKDDTEKRFIALFLHLGIEDPCNLPSKEIIAEHKRNMVNYELRKRVQSFKKQ